MNVLLFLSQKQRRTPMPRDHFTLKCTDCGEENYIANKNKKEHPERMEIKKYCWKCKKHTVHKEKK